CDISTGECSSTDKTPPVFTNLDNQIIYSNQSLYYSINATDTQSGVDSFTINWTTQFNIVSQTGILTNISSLSKGNYYIKILIKDKAGNINSGILLIEIINSSSSNQQSSQKIIPLPPALPD
ncbi:MAG: hypothetical protein AABX99_00735, partial [Nanoarchaeota archaeon]